MDAITMRELQKISAGTIAALQHAVPVKSGAETVAVLVPLRRASPEAVASVLREVDEAAARRTPEQARRLAEAVEE